MAKNKNVRGFKSVVRDARNEARGFKSIAKGIHVPKFGEASGMAFRVILVCGVCSLVTSGFNLGVQRVVSMVMGLL